jgi:pectate lyase
VGVPLITTFFKKNMEMKKTIKKVILLCLVVGVAVIMGTCSKKQEPNISAPVLNATGNATSSLAALAIYPIDESTIRLDTLNSYKAGPIPFSGDSNQQPTGSTLRVFENDVELGPAHTFHEDIRQIGRGSFSHWGTDIYFSTSDNTNPLTNGRKYAYIIAGIAKGPVTQPGNAVGTPTTEITSKVLGYANVHRPTTGGIIGPAVTVTNLADFKAAVAGPTPKTVYVSGIIKGAGYDPVYVGSNTSIIGESGGTLEGVNLYLFTVNNVILQNLILKNYVTESSVCVKFRSHHIWIDHCDFSTDRSHGWDYWGKDIVVTEGADLITISWCKFHDTNLSVLIGALTADAVAANKDLLHVTMHHNFWYNVSEREPSLIFGNIHMFNNYHLNNGGYSIGARYGATVRTDNEYFSGCNKPLTTNLDGDPVGYFSGVTTNIYLNCGLNNITSAISDWVPNYSYSAILDPAANVPSIVQAGAGVK